MLANSCPACIASPLENKNVPIVDACEADLGRIVEIYNDAVLHSTAVWNERPVDLEDRRRWWSARVAQGFPVLVARDGVSVLGFASFADWRAFDGYRHTIEHSIYVASDVRGRGIGGQLLAALIERARGLGKHVMIGGIESGNAASIRLHERFGFQEAGRMAQVGAKFGRWLDLTFMQLILDNRPEP